MIEKEIKKILQFDEFNKVMDLFNFEKPIFQTNYYYYSNKVPSDFTIRIREKNEKYKLQVKVPQFVDNCLHIKEEYEQIIDGVPNFLTKEKISKLIGREILDDVNYIGKLVTERYICRDYINIEMSLDINSYLGVTDYEMEIEYNTDYPDELIEKLRIFGIEFDKQTVGKYTRFLAKLEAYR